MLTPAEQIQEQQERLRNRMEQALTDLRCGWCGAQFWSVRAVQGHIRSHWRKRHADTR